MDKEISEKCSVRISKALSIRGMKQSELCEKTGIPKSAISQYISGSFEPKQDRLFLIAQALDVDPVWLMGFDVPMEKEKPTTQADDGLSEEKRELIERIKKLPEDKVLVLLQVARSIK